MNRWLPAWMLLPCAAAAAANGPYRLVEVDVTSLPRVRVTADARPSADGSRTLAPDAFRLAVDGSPDKAAAQTVKFRDTGKGVALVVALDASQSMKGRPLAAIREGLAKLVSRRREGDRVAVLSFADDVRWETKWDAASGAVEAAFTSFETRGKRTRLYDAVAEALDELSAESGRNANFPLRQAILVISDGHDEGSRTGWDAIQRRLQGSRVRLDATGLAWSPAWFPVLRSMAAAGFGDFRTASTPESLSGILERGIESLLDEPVLEFADTEVAADGKSHRIGLTHAGGWKEEFNVKLPERAMWKRPITLVPTSLVLVVLAAGAARRRRAKAAAAAGKPGAEATPAKPGSAEAASKPDGTVGASSPAGAGASTAAKRPAGGGPKLEFLGENAMPVSRQQTTVEPPARGGTREPGAAGPGPAPAAAPKPERAKTELAPPADAAPPRGLRAVAGPYSGKRVELTADEFWIGSRDSNHLCLSADQGVSGNHACLRREKNILRVYDNGSLNNTWVNGRAIGPEAVVVRQGDHIRIGGSEFLLEA